MHGLQVDTCSRVGIHSPVQRGCRHIRGICDIIGSGRLNQGLRCHSIQGDIICRVDVNCVQSVTQGPCVSEDDNVAICPGKQADILAAGTRIPNNVLPESDVRSVSIALQGRVNDSRTDINVDHGARVT